MQATYKVQTIIIIKLKQLHLILNRFDNLRVKQKTLILFQKFGDKTLQDMERI